MSRYEQMMKKFYGPGITKYIPAHKEVPLEPTDAMIQAGVKAFQHARYQEADPLADWRDFYRACIKAYEERR